MLTTCDRYWWKLNKNYLIILLCSLPVALVFPLLSLIMPVIILYLACDKFFVLFGCADTNTDSLRFMMTMPFSRAQIYRTYLRGLSFISIGYALPVGVIRLILSHAGLPSVIFWSNTITTGYDLLCYMVLLLTCLLMTDLLLILLVEDYTIINKGSYLTVVLLVVPSMLLVLLFLKNILMFATGLLRTKMGVNYEFSDIFKIGIPAGIAQIITVALYLIFSIAMQVTVFALSRVIRRQFVRGVHKC